MNVSELLQHAADMTGKAQAIMARKNHDYAGASGDTPFRNFTRVEDLGICNTETGILVRMTDKMSRLCTYVEERKFLVGDETFDDTLLDLINYCIILSCYCKQQNKQSNGSMQPLTYRGQENRT